MNYPSIAVASLNNATAGVFSNAANVIGQIGNSIGSKLSEQSYELRPLTRDRVE